MPSVIHMSKTKDIPEQMIKDNAAFYKPADGLIQAVKEYYERVEGETPSAKVVEKQVLRIIRGKI